MTLNTFWLCCAPIDLILRSICSEVREQTQSTVEFDNIAFRINSIKASQTITHDTVRDFFPYFSGLNSLDEVFQENLCIPLKTGPADLLQGCVTELQRDFLPFFVTDYGIGTGSSFCIV